MGRICADPADKTTTATELCTFGAVDNQMSGGFESPKVYLCAYGPMDKAPAYGVGDSGFESQ